MTNQDLAKIFYEIAVYLYMEEISFKPQAYEKAAFSIETLSEDIGSLYKKGGIGAIENIPGIGKSIAEKIIEYLETGKIKYHQDFKKKMPIDVRGLMAIEGVGPKIIRDLWKYLKIKNVEELEIAALAGKIRKLPNFREKTERNIIQGIEFLKKSKGRFLLGDILPKVREIILKLRELKEIGMVSPAGSVRRMKETIGDVDILATVKKTSSAKKVMDYFVSFPDIIKVWGRGATKSSIRLDLGFDVDLRIVPEESFGSALQYFTGSKEHNIEIRKIAIKNDFKLNEYGIYKGKKKIPTPTEEDVYRILNLKYIEPELRENSGEIEAFSLRGTKRPPEIISYRGIKGDLHCHSNWNGGENSILEMAEAAREIGYEYIGIADHTKFLRIENGLDEKELIKQRREIDGLNLNFENKGLKFRILQGCEANIMADGSIDIKDEVLSKLDYVIAGVHSQMKLPREKMTERIIKAMKNPNVDIISHPTGRIIKKRDEYQIDFNEILKTAKETKTVLEINSYPERLDLNDKNIRRAKELGVKMVINTDSHKKNQLGLIEFGIAQARRGWAEKEDIINAQNLGGLLNYF